MSDEPIKFSDWVDPKFSEEPSPDRQTLKAPDEERRQDRIRDGERQSEAERPWWKQYEDQANALEADGYHGAADDLKTLVDGIKQLECEIADLQAQVKAMQKDSSKPYTSWMQLAESRGEEIKSLQAQVEQLRAELARLRALTAYELEHGG